MTIASHALSPSAAVDAPGGAAAATRPGRVVVGIATTGRPDIVPGTILALGHQTRLPDLVVVSVAEEGDIAAGALPDLPFPFDRATGPKGLTRQRNRILERLRPDDLLLLIDDDFLLAPDFLERMVALFAARPDIVMLTGTVLADGILGPGYGHDEGARLLSDGLARPAEDRLTDVFNGYGCNFAMRARPVTAHGLRFDEALPLYGWLEDMDFSRQLAPHGRIVRAGTLRGVHLGTKTGRSPGRRLGYSQVANPIYLLGKGTTSVYEGIGIMLRNLAANMVRAVRPQPWTDHRGRLRGNLDALVDLLRGRLHPMRALDLPG